MYDSIQKFAISQGDHYTTGFLLDCNYLKKRYKIFATDLSQKQALDFEQNEYIKLI